MTAVLHVSVRSVGRQVEELIITLQPELSADDAPVSKGRP